MWLPLLDVVEASGVPLLEEHEGRPSIEKLVSQGYEVITF